MPLPLIPVGKLPPLATSLHSLVRVVSITYSQPLRSPSSLPPLLAVSRSQAFRRQQTKGETQGRVSHVAFVRSPIT